MNNLNQSSLNLNEGKAMNNTTQQSGRQDCNGGRLNDTVAPTTGSEAAAMNKGNRMVPATAARPKDDVKSPVGFGEDIMQKICSISHVVPTMKAVGYAVVAFSAMMKDNKVVECNRNLVANFDTAPTNYRALMAEPDVSPNKVNGLGFGFEGKGLAFGDSPIGATAAQFKTGPRMAGYKPAVEATFGLPSMPRACTVQWRYASLFQGDVDDRDRGEGVGVMVGLNRAELRDAMLDGRSVEVNGNRVEAYGSLRDCMAEAGPFGDRHFFLAVCRVVKVQDAHHDGGRQIRLFSDEVTIYHVRDYGAAFPNHRMFGFDVRALVEGTVEVQVEAV